MHVFQNVDRILRASIGSMLLIVLRERDSCSSVIPAVCSLNLDLSQSELLRTTTNAAANDGRTSERSRPSLVAKSSRRKTPRGMERRQTDPCRQSHLKVTIEGPIWVLINRCVFAARSSPKDQMLVLWKDSQMHIAARFDVARSRAGVVVCLVRLQKDILSSDFDTASQSKQARRGITINHL